MLTRCHQHHLKSHPNMGQHEPAAGTKVPELLCIAAAHSSANQGQASTSDISISIYPLFQLIWWDIKADQCCSPIKIGIIHPCLIFWDFPMLSKQMLRFAFRNPGAPLHVKQTRNIYEPSTHQLLKQLQECWSSPLPSQQHREGGCIPTSAGKHVGPCVSKNVLGPILALVQAVCGLLQLILWRDDPKRPHSSSANAHQVLHGADSPDPVQ